MKTARELRAAREIKAIADVWEGLETDESVSKTKPKRQKAPPIEPQKLLTPEAIREVMDTTWTEYLWPIISESDKTDVLVFEQKTAVHDVLFPSLPTALVTLRKLAIGAKVENDVIKRRWDKLLFAVLALIREMAETTYSVHLATCSARTVLVMEWGYLSGPDHFDRVVGQLRKGIKDSF